MDSFPLLKLNSLILQRFTALCHPEDAAELGQTCEMLKTMVKKTCFKMVAVLCIYGKALPPGLPRYAESSASEFGILRLSVQDPDFEEIVRNTIVTEKLYFDNIQRGLIAKLMNLGVIWKGDRFCICCNQIEREEFHALFRSQNSIKIAEIQKVSIFPVISFSDTLESMEKCSHVLIDIPNMKFSSDPMKELMEWKNSDRVHQITIRMPSDAFTMDKFVEFYKKIRPQPFCTTFIFNGLISRHMNDETKSFFFKSQRFPNICGSFDGTQILNF